MRIALYPSENGTNGNNPHIGLHSKCERRWRNHVASDVRQGTQISRNKKKPWRNGQGKCRSEMLCGDLLGGGNYLVKLSRGLLVLGEHDVDLRVGRNGNYYAAIGIEVHDF